MRHTLPGGVTVANRWNAVVDPSRPATTVHNASYNGPPAPGASTTWGMTLSGDDRDLGTLSRTAS